MLCRLARSRRYGKACSLGRVLASAFEHLFTQHGASVAFHRRVVGSDQLCRQSKEHPGIDGVRSARMSATNAAARLQVSIRGEKVTGSSPPAEVPFSDCAKERHP